jgi:hypothetical protein
MRFIARTLCLVPGRGPPGKKLCQVLAETLFEPSINHRASCNFRVLPPSDNWSLCRRFPVWKINNQPP